MVYICFFAVEQRAEALVEGYKAELENFKAGLETSEEDLRVFVYDSGEDSPFTAGRYAMPTALIEAAGGYNIMDDFENFKKNSKSYKGPSGFKAFFQKILLDWLI